MSDHDQAIHIVGVCGSTREGSYNRTLLHTAASLFPEQIVYQEANITSLPFYNQDHKANLPEQVATYVNMIKRDKCGIIWSIIF